MTRRSTNLKALINLNKPWTSPKLGELSVRRCSCWVVFTHLFCFRHTYISHFNINLTQTQTQTQTQSVILTLLHCKLSVKSGSKCWSSVPHFAFADSRTATRSCITKLGQCKSRQYVRNITVMLCPVPLYRTRNLHMLIKVLYTVFKVNWWVVFLWPECSLLIKQRSYLLTTVFRVLLSLSGSNTPTKSFLRSSLISDIPDVEKVSHEPHWRWSLNVDSIAIRLLRAFGTNVWKDVGGSPRVPPAALHSLCDVCVRRVVEA